MKNRYLVEEFKEDAQGEHITFHALADGDTPQEAFVKASKFAPVMYTVEWDDLDEEERATLSRESYDPEAHFYFGANELVEIDEGYRWAASDGSSVCYEVRLISIIVES